MHDCLSGACLDVNCAHKCGMYPWEGVVAGVRLYSVSPYDELWWTLRAIVAD